MNFHKKGMEKGMVYMLVFMVVYLVLMYRDIEMYLEHKSYVCKSDKRVFKLK